MRGLQQAVGSHKPDEMGSTPIPATIGKVRVIRPARPRRPTNPLTRLRVRRAAKPYRWALKLEMIKAYGGACACCGEDIPHFLSLEHTRGDGAEHRRKVGDNAQAQLVDLKRRGWPKDGYTVLCLNCNIAKGAHGTCPHQMEEYQK